MEFLDQVGVFLRHHEDIYFLDMCTLDSSSANLNLISVVTLERRAST